MKSKRPTSAIQQLYDSYEYMAKVYADKIFNYDRYGYEKEDVIQEFRIKIYTSIISYSAKWAEYKETGRYKPVLIEFYLKTAMVNKVKDFIKLFNMSSVENVDKISIETDGFDYAKYSTASSVISLNESICEVNGVNLLEGLVGRKLTIFSDYLAGFSVKEIQAKFPTLDVEDVIEKQIDFLRGHENTLFDYQNHEYNMMSFVED